MSHGEILYAVVPDAGTPEHVPQSFELALVIGINIVIAVVMWVLTRLYSESLVREATASASD